MHYSARDRHTGVDTPITVLRDLALSPWTPERDAFIKNFRPLRLPQQNWAKRLLDLASSTAGHLPDLSFQNLDELSLTGNP